ncbi:hypothetical protein OFC62_41785, partial [Escherichia coli]|nr:hypothetical protein [Escherichia coli]
VMRFVVRVEFDVVQLSCAEGRRRGVALGACGQFLWTSILRRGWPVDKSRRLRGSKIGAGSRLSLRDRYVLAQGVGVTV